MSNLIAFHGEEKIKQRYVKRVQAHYDADAVAYARRLHYKKMADKLINLLEEAK